MNDRQAPPAGWQTRDDHTPPDWQPSPESEPPPESQPPTESQPPPDWQPSPNAGAPPAWQPSPGATVPQDRQPRPDWQPPPPGVAAPPELPAAAARLPLRELLSQGVQLDGAGFRVGVTAAALALLPVALIATGLPDLPGSLLRVAAYFLAEGAIVQLFAVLYARGRPQIWSAYGIAARKVPALIGATFLQVVVVVLVVALLWLALPSQPELLLLVAAPIVLFLLARWSLYAQVIVLENHGPLAGLKRSWALVRGSTLRMLTVFALFWLFSIVSGVAVLSLLDEFLAGGLDPFVATLLGASVDVVVAPVVPAGLTVAYFDVLGRTERARFRRRPAAPPAAPPDQLSPAQTS